MLKKMLLVLTALLLVCAPLGYAEEEYVVPENFEELIGITYDSIYQYVEVDDNLFYDLFLFDNNCLALSALARGQASEFSFNQIKAYYKESIQKYDLQKNFYLMVMVYDLATVLDTTTFASQVGILNSKGEAIFGQEVERYSDGIFIISYPKEKLEQHLLNDKVITVELQGKNDTTLATTFNRNYRENIPPKIRELIGLLEN